MGFRSNIKSSFFLVFSKVGLKNVLGFGEGRIIRLPTNWSFSNLLVCTNLSGCGSGKLEKFVFLRLGKDAMVESLREKSK